MSKPLRPPDVPPSTIDKGLGFPTAPGAFPHALLALSLIIMAILNLIITVVWTLWL